MKIRATFTNLAYVAVGVWAIIQSAVAPGSFIAVLGGLSGVHHWFLEKWSKTLDYAGMYSTSISLTLWMLGASTEFNLLISTLLTLAGLIFTGASKILVGALIAITFGTFFHFAGFFWGMILLAIMALAYSMNELGDTKAFKKFHGILHGQIWHIWTATALMILIYIILYG